MKKFLPVLVLLLGSWAQAFPGVGDHVVFEGTESSQPVRYEFTVTAHYPASARWIVHYVRSVNGVVVEDKLEVDHDGDLPTASEVANTLANCAALGGVPQTVVVPAGSFNACAMSDGGETAWIGDVPFGLVKGTSDDVSLELVEYQSGP
jgi:hypothetical protein